MGYLKCIGKKKYLCKYEVPPTNGKRRQQKTETLTDVTQKEAKAILADREKLALDGGVDVKVTFDDVFPKFINAKRFGDRSPLTIQRYESIYRTYIGPRFGPVALSKIKRVHLLDAYATWRADRKDKKAGVTSALTIKHVHDLIRGILNWAMSSNIVRVNEAAKIRRDDLPKITKPDKTILTGDEVTKLLREALHPSSRSRKRGYVSAYSAFHPAVVFLAMTGARRGEGLALRWSSVDLDHGAVTIRESLAQTASGLVFKAPKSGKARTLSIGPNLVATLRSHREVQAGERGALGASYLDNDLVFAKPDGSPMTPWNFGSAFADLVKRAEVRPIRLHDLRHTHASFLLAEGCDIKVISERLGHSDISITARTYLSVSREQDAKAASLMDRLAA